jgi:hypothetical protein
MGFRFFDGATIGDAESTEHSFQLCYIRGD